VVTLYTKTGAKNSPHAWVEKVTSVSAVSNAVVRVFAQATTHGQNLSELAFHMTISMNGQRRPLRQYSLISANDIICSLGPLADSEGLNREPVLIARGIAYQRICRAWSSTASILNAVQNLKKRKKAKSSVPDAMEIDDDQYDDIVE